MKNDCIRKALYDNILEAQGCTEPIAVAYAASEAVRLLGREPQRIEASLSANVIKNALIVCLPGTKGKYGLPLALALGALCGDAPKLLKCLENIGSCDVERAERFVSSGAVKLELSKNRVPLYINVKVFKEGESAEVIIEGRHTNVTYAAKNGVPALDRRSEKSCVIRKKTSFDINDIWEYIIGGETDTQMARKIIDVNCAVSDEGLRHEYGLCIGKTVKEKGDKKADLLLERINYILERTTAGVDARMAGAELPVMSNSGSGNQGLVTTLPVIAAAEVLESDESEKQKAVLLASLITIYIKSRNRLLSAYCGAAVASGGVAAGIAYLLSGNLEQIKSAIQNSLGNSFGMLCDGAKETCSLKVANCTFSAVYSAYLAVKCRCPKAKEGLIADRVELTIDNIASLCDKTSDKVDCAMMKLMLE